MKLVSRSARPEYTAWAAVALHCAPGAAEAAGLTRPLPANATGGGRGFGLRPVGAGEAAAAGGLRLAETLLERVLDKMAPAERHGELLGLYIHTLVRQGKAKAAYDIVIDGKFAYVASEAELTAAAGAGGESAAPKRRGTWWRASTVCVCVCAWV